MTNEEIIKELEKILWKMQTDDNIIDSQFMRTEGQELKYNETNYDSDSYLAGMAEGYISCEKYIEDLLKQLKEDET